MIRKLIEMTHFIQVDFLLFLSFDTSKHIGGLKKDIPLTKCLRGLIEIKYISEVCVFLQYEKEC